MQFWPPGYVIFTMKRLVFATNNEHKLQEARAILGSDVEIISLSELGCFDDIPETQPTLEGNALQKAHYIRDRYGVACVADDTGLMVDALNGEPGVRSARYATPGHDSAANMAKLLGNMEGVENREAHFSTILAYADAEEDRLFEGRVDGFIATEPSGNSGFGYDPVFIAAETGRTFADMTADEKNAISHRGRAFRKFRDWFLTLCTLICLLVPASGASAAPRWAYHHNYDGQTDRIIDTPDLTYFLTMRQLYRLDMPDNAGDKRYGLILRYDKRNDEWKWLDKSTGLSEFTVVQCEYDFDTRQLVIAYQNGNIDLLKDDGTKINIPGLLGADGNASTDIKSISIDTEGRKAWIATSTGYVCINLTKGEVATSRNYGKPVMSVAKFGGKLFVGTPTGLLAGDERDSTLDNFRQLKNWSNVWQLIPCGNRLYALAGAQTNKQLFALTARGDSFDTQYLSRYNERSAERTAGGLYVAGDNNLRVYDPSGNVTTLPIPTQYNTKVSGSYDLRSFWFSNDRKGLSRLKLDNYKDPSAQWSVTLLDYMPSNLHAFIAPEMVWHDRYGMLVRNQGMQGQFIYKRLLLPDLLSAYKDGAWTALSTPYTLAGGDAAFTMKDPSGIAVDPNNTDHIYGGSLLSGLLRLNTADPAESLRLVNSADPAKDLKGALVVVPAAAEWTAQSFFRNPTFDAYGNLWTMHITPAAKEQFQLWCWPPADRAASTSASSFREFHKYTFNTLRSNNMSFFLPMMSSANRNLIVVAAGNYQKSFMVLDHKGTVTDPSDDVYAIIPDLRDQDGVMLEYVPTMSMYEDKTTGRVWVTTNRGVYHFNPRDVLNGNTDVRRVKVPRNDGTNLADYLLDGTCVLSMTADPIGNKWFATQGAGVVVTSSDGREIINTYTADNSGLPDNTVYGIAYNPQNNSMMISTDGGLCEVFLQGTSEDPDDEVRAYPNPVRPGYVGYVTIDGLPIDGFVKIMSINGSLVRELGQSIGGEITWDLTDHNHRRVPAGIYYVYASNGADRQAYSKLTKILVAE